MKISAEVIIVGAGQGKRMGAAQPKVFLPVGRVPMLAHSLAAFSSVSEIAGLIVVVPEGQEDRVRTLCVQLPGLTRVRAVVTGGARRQDSVQAGLDQVAKDTDVVLVHDAARPLVSAELIRRVLAAAAEHGAAAPGVPVADTLKRCNARQEVESTLDRRNLVAIQTPQGFRAEVLRRAYAQAWQRGTTATDDAGLVEALGLVVKIVAGEAANFKLTAPQDVSLAEAWLANKRGRGIKGVSGDE